jgi:preprotein translocase subunit SecD
MNLRENWRIVFLAVLVVLSGVALFIPSGGAAGADNGTNGTNRVATGGDPTNLQYGLELSGGTRLRAQLVGMTAEDVQLPQDSSQRIRNTVSDQLGLDGIDVRIRRTSQTAGTIEVFSENVTQQEFANALQAADLDVSTDQIRAGVTEQTFDTTQRVLTDRINAGGLTGGGASIVRSPTGENFIVVEVPNANRSEVLDIIGSPGRVEVVAEYPVRSGNETVYRNQSVLTQGDFTDIGPARRGEGGRQPFVQVSLTQEAAQEFARATSENGFLDEGVGNCRWRTNPEDPGWCLYTVVDGEVTYAASMGSGLADIIRSGAFVQQRTFTLEATSFEEAQEVKINLESGALPTELDIQSELFLAPSLAQAFKPLALITGLVAWLVVSGVVFYRYREARIAIPMLATAGAEVFILLGFAATIGLALDLSHIAGLIAVIGTGVDDLIIIADEILQEGKVATGRVFQNRFRKAFWVIGAAAATTIIAMSPLAVLSLGDLQGFAIVTIVGVLIGVLVTRPAYGDVLRNLLLEDA